MTEYDDLPFTVPDDMPTIGARPRPCRHRYGDDGTCTSCGHRFNFKAQRQGRKNKRNGIRTSEELALYLGGNCVEGKQLPWDVEACGAYIQSKREAKRPSDARILALCEYIPFRADSLRCLFWVEAGRRLTSGSIFAVLQEWVLWRGWSLPEDAHLFLAGSDPLIELPVAEFRDLARGGNE